MKPIAIMSGRRAANHPPPAVLFAPTTPLSPPSATRPRDQVTGYRPSAATAALTLRITQADITVRLR